MFVSLKISLPHIIKFKHFERGKGKKIKNMKNIIYAKVVGKIDPKEHLS